MATDDDLCMNYKYKDLKSKKGRIVPGLDTPHIFNVYIATEYTEYTFLRIYCETEYIFSFIYCETGWGKIQTLIDCLTPFPNFNCT